MSSGDSDAIEIHLNKIQAQCRDLQKNQASLNITLDHLSEDVIERCSRASAQLNALENLHGKLVEKRQRSLQSERNRADQRKQQIEDNVAQQLKRSEDKVDKRLQELKDTAANLTNEFKMETRQKIDELKKILDTMNEYIRKLEGDATSAVGSDKESETSSVAGSTSRAPNMSRSSSQPGPIQPSTQPGPMHPSSLPNYTWIIDGIRSKYTTAQEGRVQCGLVAPHRYIDEDGYEAQVNLYLNGQKGCANWGQSVALRCRLLSDSATIVWPVTKRITLTIKDRSKCNMDISQTAILKEFIKGQIYWMDNFVSLTQIFGPSMEFDTSYVIGDKLEILVELG